MAVWWLLLPVLRRTGILIIIVIVIIIRYRHCGWGAALEAGGNPPPSLRRETPGVRNGTPCYSHLWKRGSKVV